MVSSQNKKKVFVMRLIGQVSWVLAFQLLVCLASGAAPAAEMIDLSQTTISAMSDSNRIIQTAHKMLREEIAARTGIRLRATRPTIDQKLPAIVLCSVSWVPESLREFVHTMDVPPNAEGFAIAIHRDGGVPTIVLAGRDERGVLYAVGQLLLKMRMGPGIIEVPASLRIATAPRYAYRGHQIAFRNLAHCYDAWTPAVYEQYMRELAVFGANAFETTGFSASLPHAKVTGDEMSAAWSRICADYGFQFWLFSSAIGGDGRTPEELESAMARQVEALRRIPHVDHLYVTGGDGGTHHARPDLMFEWTERLAREARKIHPSLGVWVSNQGFGPERNNWFFGYLQRHQPNWVTGVAYGPWTRILLNEQRARLPEQYPIRRYADIGHCVRAQYPVSGWDRAFAQTLGREPFAPRARAHARIHNLFDEYADGCITYSDGVGDDVNKFVWTALDWNPDRDVDEILLDYTRFFFGWDIGEQARDGLLMLEENFSGSLAKNAGVEETYALWVSLEESADAQLKANWRFQQCLLRACYDHYTRLRLIRSHEIESRALAILSRAADTGVETAIERAGRIIAESDQDPTTQELRARIVQLGKQLFDSIGAQLDVSRYKAETPERGAVLDFLDVPLNNRLWIEDELDAILAGRVTATMPEWSISAARNSDLRLERINRLIYWEDPGPGGYYDDLGCAWKQPHLRSVSPRQEDPAGVTVPREDHSQYWQPVPARLSWLDVAEGLNATRLEMHYEGLDPESVWRVRVTYLGRYGATVRLVADDQHEIHGAYGSTVRDVRYTTGYSDGPAVVNSPDEGFPIVTPLEFPIPPAATQDGTLDLTWQRMTGRGIQVAEVWLIKEPALDQ